MKTFSIQTLGCKVNHYESEQIASALRARGLVQAEPAQAELRVVNTCSVTTHAGSQSRQSVRRVVRLPLLPTSDSAQPHPVSFGPCCSQSTGARDTGGRSGLHHPSSQIVSLSVPAGFEGTFPSEPDRRPAAEHEHNREILEQENHPSTVSTEVITGTGGSKRPRVLVMGCWATSDRAAALAMPGVDAVLTHHEDAASQLGRLLTDWAAEDANAWGDPHSSGIHPRTGPANSQTITGTRSSRVNSSAEPIDQKDDGWMKQAGAPAGQLTWAIKQKLPLQVNPIRVEPPRDSRFSDATGTTRLPLLGDRQSGRQRALLKVQDGCDAHCTYCIIPTLRPRLWSKPLEDVVNEAQALVDAGHVELVLTGIFLGAYGQPTALRRRQPAGGSRAISELIETLCTRVKGLRRVRLSSLEPGDLTDNLIATLREHEQVVPHFHLPLQSGSDAILRLMNRQYTRADFLRMIDRVRSVFDRPALTTDVVVAFPGEDDAEFEETAELVRSAGFIHVHAFPYSPRPGTAAARWADQFVHGPAIAERLERLRAQSEAQSFVYRSSFVGQAVEVIVEQGSEPAQSGGAVRLHHGRCERYFAVHFEGDIPCGEPVKVRVNRVTPQRTFGERVA